MKSPLTPEQLESLRRLDGCTLANAIETFNVRLRNEGFTDGRLRCFFPRLPPIVGYAATVKIRGSAPPTAGGFYHQRTDWWDYVRSLPAPVAMREGAAALTRSCVPAGGGLAYAEDFSAAELYYSGPAYQGLRRLLEQRDRLRDGKVVLIRQGGAQ